MSSPRVQKILQGLPEGLHRLGYTTAITAQNLLASVVWMGRDTALNDAIIIDLDSQTSWTTGNRRVIVEAIPAHDSNNTQGLLTQSHSLGQFIDGSVSLVMYVEQPSSWTAAQSQFERDMLHILVGQLGAPVDLKYTANGTQPTLAGANGAGSTAATTDAGMQLPYGYAYPGGI